MNRISRGTTRALQAYVEAYRGGVGAIRDIDLARRQLPPWASLGEGAAGTAYTLWRLGDRRSASRWADAALADRRRAAFHSTLCDRTRASSLMFGRVGVRWTAALVKGGTHTDRFAKSLEAGATRLEFATGAAGHLLASIVLLRRRSHPRLARCATALAGRLETGLVRRGHRTWTPRDATGFAHGWVGVLFALLEWYRFSGVAVPSPAVGALTALAGAWSPDTVQTEALQPSWCNGAAGASLLWARAFESTGDRRFSRLAARAAHAAVRTSGRSSTLCCGDAGVGFALLAMHRIDPSGGWRGQAAGLCARAIAQVDMPRAFGLFQGHGGLVCLAADCVSEAPQGFPAVEG
ncbi:MAG: lanthionine synthetase LanC family protein [Vicinamibacterales bacterium]